MIRVPRQKGLCRWGYKRGIYHKRCTCQKLFLFDWWHPSERKKGEGSETDEMLDGDACDDDEIDGDDNFFEVGVNGVVCTIFLCNSLNNSSNSVS